MLQAHERIIFVLLMSTIVTISPGLAAGDKGWPSVQKIVALFSSERSDEGYRQASALIDYDAMAQRSLGAQWSTLTLQQKRDYTAALRALMQQRYYPRWHRIFSKAKLDYVTQSFSGGDLIVKTNLVVGKKLDSLSWRLNDRNGKVISLAIGEKDLLTRLTDRLAPKLKKGGFQPMLTWMQAHTKRVDATNTQASSAEAMIGESR